MSQFISETEDALQKIAKALSKFELPAMTSEIREALWMNIGEQDVLNRLCESVSKYSNGNVKMRPVPFSEQVKLFYIEVMGPAAYYVLESNNKTQLVILTSDGVIFDKGQ